MTMCPSYEQALCASQGKQNRRLLACVQIVQRMGSCNMKVAAYAAPVHWNNKNWAAFAKAKLVLGAPRTGTPLMQHTILQAANLISPGCEQISQCIINQRHEIAAAPQVHQVINCRLETQRLLPSGLNSCPFFLSLYFIRSDDVGLQAPIQFYHGGKRPAAVHFKEELARRKWWQRRKRWMKWRRRAGRRWQCCGARSWGQGKAYRGWEWK
mmetsp:Transcript_27534/g.74489  ORF Transcript_27534/g.74489 Transcript_27534/m.74489 type:complete len:211 (+) Transcript_27534:911-1543(+)